jgi:hypothetical protein
MDPAVDLDETPPETSTETPSVKQKRENIGRGKTVAWGRGR